MVPGYSGQGWGVATPLSNGLIEQVLQHKLADRLVSQLTERQRQVFELLVQGTGIRAAGRQLGMSHVAVLKHRGKIARAAGRVIGNPASASAATAVPARAHGLAPAAPRLFAASGAR